MTSIADRESLQSVLTKINGLFDDTAASDARLSAVEATSDGNSTAIDVLDGRVDAAEITIADNTADIATNTADIAVLNVRTNNGIPGTVTSKSSGFTAVAGDRGRVFHVTATLTASLTAAATLADGWHADFYVETGTLTIDPAGAETISGASTISVTAGRSVRVVCDGSAFYAVGLTVSTDSPTFTGTVTAGGLTVSTTGTMRLPVGTTAQRPGSPSAGDFRYNSTTGYPDIYNGSAWRTATVNEAAAITGGTINGASIGATTPAAVTASTLNLSGSSVGDVFYHNGTSIVRLASGTSGQFLKSNGAAAPSWSDRSTYTSFQAASGLATVEFSGLPSGITSMHVAFLTLSTSAVTDIQIQMSTGGAYETSGYNSGSFSSAMNGTGASAFTIVNDSAANSYSGRMSLERMTTTGYQWGAMYGANYGSGGHSGGGFKAMSGHVDAVKVFVSSGTFDAGFVYFKYVVGA